MEPSEDPQDPVHSGPRDHSSATNRLSTRGRKRDSTALTTPVGGSTFRDRSNDQPINFKKPRCLTPVGGSTFRDRSNDRFILFKKPQRLQKHRRRVKSVTARGNAPPAANVSVRKMTTPTASLAPPTPSLAPPTPAVVRSKAWADYDEEDDRRVYEEDPATLFLETDRPLSLCTPDPALPPPDPALPPPHSALPPPHSALPPPHSALPPPDAALPPQDVILCGSEEEADETPQSETLKRTLHYLLSQIYKDFMDEVKAEQRIVQLLRREDERSREQDSAEHLEKQDLISLFRDIEKAGKNSQCTSSDYLGMGFQISPFREEQDVNIARFLFLREEEGLREETQRLRRYQTLLEQWSETFTQVQHDVSACVGRLLKNMLKQVHKDIDYLSEVRRLQPLCLPSKHFSGMSPSAFRKMKKSMMEKFRPNMDELRRWQMYCPHLSLLSFKSDLTLTVLCTFGRFYQSSSKKARRSLAARNTRKWLRCLHTRTAGGAQRRSRRRLIDSGLKLRSHVTRGSGLSLKPGDRTDLSTSSVSHSQSLTPN